MIISWGFKSLYPHKTNMKNKLKNKSEKMLKKKNESLIIDGPLGQTTLSLKKNDPYGFYAVCVNDNCVPNWTNTKVFEKPSYWSITTKEKNVQKFLSNPILNKIENKKEQTKTSKQKNQNLPSIFSQKVQGISRGFFLYLKIVGIGYRVFLNDNILTLKLGFSHLYKVKIPNSVKIFLPEATLLCLYGIDKNQVSQIAAQITQVKKPSPYKGKGIRILDSQVRLKTGKKKS
uniref:ribosomal protein L6 n=1 Tax=Tetraselmis marina TaxID=41888 RepID=UPI0021824227|nr:ribosomal protein L6 [Tetraselmis marina]UVF37908.1 ribosomal protein L6 [Tetraselmis marina]